MRWLAAALAALAVPVPARSQVSTAAAVPVPAAAPDPSRVIAFRDSFRVVQVSRTAEAQVAMVQQRVLLTDTDIIWQQSITDATGRMADSSVADRATLAPRWHRSDSERRSMALEFTRGHVTGKYADAGEPAYEINETVSERTYDSNMLDLLVAALPLAAGYRGRLQVFLWEAGGEIPADVAVTGSEDVDGQSAWVAEVTLMGKPARYYVSKREPRVLRISSSPAPGVEIRFVRALP